jgi:hypothetical protein
MEQKTRPPFRSSGRDDQGKPICPCRRPRRLRLPVFDVVYEPIIVKARPSIPGGATFPGG